MNCNVKQRELQGIIQKLMIIIIQYRFHIRLRCKQWLIIKIFIVAITGKMLTKAINSTKEPYDICHSVTDITVDYAKRIWQFSDLVCSVYPYFSKDPLCERLREDEVYFLLKRTFLFNLPLRFSLSDQAAQSCCLSYYVSKTTRVEFSWSLWATCSMV